MDDDFSKWIEKAFKSYSYYFRTVWPVISEEQLKWNWHIDYICNQLQELSTYIINREPSPYDLIINIPPGMTKSTIVSQAWIGWLWLHDPSITVITSSYSTGLSADNSMKAKRVIQSEVYSLYNEAIEAIHGEKIQLIKQTETYWINNYTGFYYATSTGGTVTGKHAIVLIRDDSLKPLDAKSERKIQEANDYNDKTLSTRKKDKDGTPTVTIGQRLHQKDPSGHDLEKQKQGLKVRHISLPASTEGQVKPKELKKFYKNGLLDENRLSWETIGNEKLRLGTVGYANQYDQYTAPVEGVKVRHEWFKYCKLNEVPEGLTWDVWIDGAYTKSSSNSATGIMTVAYDNRAGLLYIIDFESKFIEMPELIKHVGNIGNNKLSNKSRIYIEPKASGLSLKQMLSRSKNLNPVNIKSHLVSEGKEARIDTASPSIEAGKVIIVEGSWNEEFISQLAYFPHWQHDEAVDLIGYAVDNYTNKAKRKKPKRVN